MISIRVIVRACGHRKRSLTGPTDRESPVGRRCVQPELLSSEPAARLYYRRRNDAPVHYAYMHTCTRCSNSWKLCRTCMSCYKHAEAVDYPRWSCNSRFMTFVSLSMDFHYLKNNNNLFILNFILGIYYEIHVIYFILLFDTQRIFFIWKGNKIFAFFYKKLQFVETTERSGKPAVEIIFRCWAAFTSQIEIGILRW